MVETIVVVGIEESVVELEVVCIEEFAVIKIMVLVGASIKSTEEEIFTFKSDFVGMIKALVSNVGFGFKLNRELYFEVDISF
jgi:hypothetical protein